MVLDIFALIVMVVILAVVIWLVVLIGPLPGKIARERNHPHAGLAGLPHQPLKQAGNSG